VYRALALGAQEALVNRSQVTVMQLNALYEAHRINTKLAYT